MTPHPPTLCVNIVVDTIFLSLNLLSILSPFTRFHPVL